MTLILEPESKNPGSLRCAGLRLFVEVQRLKNREFKKSVLDELAVVADNGHVNSTPLVREYMEKLCEVHEALREQLSIDVATWDQTLIAALHRARASFGEGIEEFKLVEKSDIPVEDDHEEFFPTVDSEDIFVGHIEWRKTLEVKNRNFGKLSARYVTGRGGPDA